MKHLSLKFIHTVIVDDDMFLQLNPDDFYICIGRGLPYARMRSQKSRPPKHTWMHRMIVDCPTGMIVHHRNGNSLDNRRENLQIMTQAEHGPFKTYRGRPAYVLNTERKQPSKDVETA